MFIVSSSIERMRGSRIVGVVCGSFHKRRVSMMADLEGLDEAALESRVIYLYLL